MPIYPVRITEPATAGEKRQSIGTQCLHCNYVAEAPTRHPYRCPRCGSTDLHVFQVVKDESRTPTPGILYLRREKFAFCLKAALFRIWISLSGGCRNGRG